MTDRKIPSDANLDLLFSEGLSFQRRGLFDVAERRYRNIIEMQPAFARGVVGSWYTPVQILAQ